MTTADNAAERQSDALLAPHPLTFYFLVAYGLYLSSARCGRPLPRGFTGHVARPTRSIHKQAS